MTAKRWAELTRYEQLSNIAGDVQRCMDSKKRYLDGTSSKDYSDFYYNKIYESILLTDEVNGHPLSTRELLDELNEIKKALDDFNDGSEEYVMRYWQQWTKAVEWERNKSNGQTLLSYLRGKAL